MCLCVCMLFVYICVSIKNWTTDIRFPAFSLARWTQVISSYTCTTKYGRWTRQQIKKSPCIFFLWKLTAIENRLEEYLTSRSSGTGPKCKWSSPLLCSECFRKTNTSAFIVMKKFFSHPWENFPCCWCSASSETHLYLRPTSRVYKLNLNWHIENLFFPSTWFSFMLSILAIRIY